MTISLVKGNQVRGALRVRSKPNVSNSNNVTINNRELLTRMTVGPVEQRFDILVNPGQFRWSSMIGSCYDMYYPAGVGFTWVPDCPTTTPGQVLMFLDYDPEDDNSGMSFERLSAMNGAKVSSVYENCSLSFNPKNIVMPNHKFLISSTNTADRLQDCAHLWVRTCGSPTSTEISAGSLYVNYVFRMFNPQSPPTMYAPTARFGLASATGGDGTATNPFGSVSKNLVTATEQSIINAVYLNAKNWLVSKIAGLFLPTSTDLSVLANIGRYNECVDFDIDGTQVAEGLKISYQPTNVAAVYVTDSSELFVYALVTYTYTAASATDIPSMGVIVGKEWTPSSSFGTNQYANGVPAAKIGVSTVIKQVFSSHYKRSKPSEHFWIQFYLTGAGIGSVNNSSVAELMVSPYPLDHTSASY